MSAVGIFSNSLTLVTMVGSIINTINIVLLPKMSELHGDNNDKEMIKVLEKSLHFQLFLTIPICFGIIAITPKMINWFFGIEFSSMIYLVPILAPIVIFQALHQGIASQFLVPKYEMHSYNITMILGTILNITLGVILVPKFNQYGAGVSFLLGQVVLAVSRTYVLTKKTNFSFNTISILKYLISSIIMFIVIYLLTFKMNPTIMTTTLQALIGIAIYLSLIHI